MKLNSYKQQACLRLVQNSTLVANVKLRWRGLYLRCEQESLYFTRAANLNVISSKRCPNMGSCKGLKCAAINSTSLVEELKDENKHPGRTGCLESCGGIVCDCFYPRSGCLFYRIYATPRNAKVYEIFGCMRWSEHVKLEVIIEDADSRTGNQQFVVYSIPNVPVILPPLKIVLTSLSLPPTPALAREFITDGVDTSIWNKAISPPLRCKTWADAYSFNCTVDDKCKCTGAETTNMEALRRNLRKVEEELAQVRKQLDDKTRALQELRRALPPIPNPEHLYRNIIDRCHQFYACTTSTTELSNRIKALSRSVDSYENRLHETSLLELSVDKVRVEILFIRFQLRTFFSAPALLCAFGLTTMEVWQAWMDRPQENEAGAPLLSRPEDIERVADDQLHQLDCHRRALTEIRASLMHEERQANLNFQLDMRRAVAELQSSLNVALQSMEQRAATAPIVDAHNDSAMEEAHEEEAPPDGDQDSSGKAPAPEDIAMQEQEREALQQN
ncbi:hypothetical protein COOONC_06199, partial [Cooperia oncophora]